MLRTRRVLAFSGRIQNYLLLLYIFFLFGFFACGYFSIEEAFVNVLLSICTFIAWIVVAFGLAIIICSLFSWLKDKVLPVSAILLSLIRIALVFFCSIVVQLINQLVTGGIVLS